MAFLTALSLALGLILVLYGIPSPRMGIDHETLPCTVAGHADLAVAVAGLASLQIPARLDRMGRRPLMLGKQPSRVTGLALRGSECSVGRTTCSGREIRPSSPV